MGQSTMLQDVRCSTTKSEGALLSLATVPGKVARARNDKIIQDQQRTQDLLTLCEARYQAILEIQTDLICRLLPDGVLTFVNEAYCRYFGHSYDEVLATNFMWVIPEADRSAAIARIATCNAAQPMVRHEHRVIRADGAVRWIDWTVQAILGEEDALIELQSVGRDITDQRCVKRALQDSEERYRRIVQTAQDGIWLLDTSDRTTFINARLAEMLGYDGEAMLGRPIFEFIDPEWHSTAMINLERCRTGIAAQADCRFTRKDGAELWVLCSTNPIMDAAENRYAGALVMVADITTRKRMEESLRRLSIQDSLTGLFNRRHFFTIAEQEFERSQRYGHPLALLMLDIDHFKQINDTHGHLVGDQVLRAVASIMRNSLRRADLLARYGGEEFVMLLPETTLLTALATASRLCTALAAEPLATDQGTVAVTASIGVAALTVCAGRTLTQLLSWADRAMYDAKQAGRNQVHSRAVTT